MALARWLVVRNVNILTLLLLVLTFGCQQLEDYSDAEFADARRQTPKLLVGYDTLFSEVRNQCVEVRPEKEQAVPAVAPVRGRSAPPMTDDTETIERDDLSGEEEEEADKRNTLGDPEKPIDAHTFEQSWDLLHVTSREDLARELGIDLGLAVKFGIGSAQGRTGLLNTFSENQNSVNLLLRIEAQYTVTHDTKVQLTEDGELSAMAHLRQGPAAFATYCGAGYAREIVYGAKFYQLIVYNARDAEAAAKLKGDIGINAGTGTEAPEPEEKEAGGGEEAAAEGSEEGGEGTEEAAEAAAEGGSERGVGISQRTSFRLTQEQKAQGISQTIRSASIGLAREAEVAEQPEAGAGGQRSVGLAQSLGTDGGEPTTLKAETYEQIKELRSLIAKRVLEDMCHDSGDGVCGDGEPATGYWNHHHRLTGVIDVVTASYDSLPNARKERTGANPFAEIRKAHRVVERYIRAYSELQQRMDHVFRGEIKLFLDAPTKEKTFYQIMPPGEPAQTVAELTEAANTWAREFRPTGEPNGTGWRYDEVDDLIKECWDESKLDISHDCWGGEDPRDNDTWRTLDGHLKEYSEGGRLGRLQLRVVEERVSGDEAEEACAKLSSLELYEPVRVRERDLLAPAVSGAMWREETWALDAKDRCPADHPYALLNFVEDKNGDRVLKQACADKDYKIWVLCRAKSSLLPSLRSPAQFRQGR